MASEAVAKMEGQEYGESMQSQGTNSRFGSDKRKPLIWPEPEDFNLTELINSVERDIWLLEQMETKSNPGHNNPDVAVFTTVNPLELPGFKPKRGPSGTY